MATTHAILVDITKCIGCRSCEQACKQIHGFPTDTETKLSPTALTVVEDHGDRFVRRMCMHCQVPRLRFGVSGRRAQKDSRWTGHL